MVCSRDATIYGNIAMYTAIFSATIQYNMPDLGYRYTYCVLQYIANASDNLNAKLTKLN